MKTKSVVIIFSLLIFSGCTLIPCSSTSGLNELENKVSQQDIVGDYELDDWTKKLIPELKNSKGELRIKSNKQIEIVNLPTAVFDDYLDGERNIKTAKGNWKFPIKSENQIITEIKFDEEFESINNTVRFWKIFSQNGRITIFVEFGDPDNCTAARFIKK